MKLSVCLKRAMPKIIENKDLSVFTRDELVERNKYLEFQIQLLQNRVANLQHIEPKKKMKAFDYFRFTKRRIALKILYLGWDYSGLAPQQGNKSTIAENLMRAFEISRILEDPLDCEFGICGRTDKGVSALSQVVTMKLRSNLHSGIGVIVPEDTSQLYAEKPEVDYVDVGNRNLPHDIRILAWAPIPDDFNPRFSCLSRTYKYFFPASNLNIELMQRAGKKLEGAFDFRNFCSSQVTNGVVNHERVLYSVEIEDSQSGDKSDPRRFCSLNIRGKAFLYHQIRCIAAVLFSIGRGLEQVELIDALLDLDKTPSKPQYQMAEPEPLLFYEPEFEGLNWQTSADAQEDILKRLQSLWTSYAVKSQLIGIMLKRVEEETCSEVQPPVNNYLRPVCAEAPSESSSRRTHILKRPREMLLEDKIRNVAERKARRLQISGIFADGDVDK